MKQSKPAEIQAPEPTIPSTKAELLKLQDIVRGINVLDTLASEGSDTDIGNLEWVTKKLMPAWELTLETLADRWKEQHPDIELPDYEL
jgi:hypothetical protein